MENEKKIKSALISVYSKEGLEPIIRKLNELNVVLYSTGGTYDYIKGLGIDVTTVESITSYPSILGGRVKTLHPKIFGGILGRRELEEDKKQMVEYEIPEIDLVIVDLYPFEDTVKSGASEADIIEKIDIGGISLIRGAAKNFNDVVIIPSMNEYAWLLDKLTKKSGVTTLEERKTMAITAFHVSSHYDSMIYNHFAIETGRIFKQSIPDVMPLRYGENPHQQGIFYGNFEEVFEQVQGKEISYNNLLDIDSAVNLIADFKDVTTFAVLKHNNACGIASRPTVLEAWNAALAADPISAFGGVLITNKEIDGDTAEEIHKIFFDIIIAPSYTEDALEVLQQKKNRTILIQKPTSFPKRQFRTVLNGVLEQAKDEMIDRTAKMVAITKVQPTAAEKEDLEFANIIVKHTKSNAIVIVKNKQLIASGMGQTSRVDSLNHAIAKAKAFNFDLKGAVLSSDAFFPFPDCVNIAFKEGITALIQPGGSIKDKDSVDACDKNGQSMIMSGTRHFKH